MNSIAYPALSEAPVRTIEREELRQKLAKGDRIKLVMCLNEFAFRAKNIPGSLHFNTPNERMAGLRRTTKSSSIARTPNASPASPYTAD